MITLVTRRPITVERAGGWGDTTVVLPEGLWEDQLRGGTIWQGEVQLKDVFADRGQALLTRMK